MNLRHRIYNYIGLANNWRLQLSSYLSIITLLGVIYLVVEENQYISGWMAIILLLVGIPLLIILNDKIIQKATQSRQFELNPRFVKLEKQVEENNKMLKEMLNR